LGGIKVPYELTKATLEDFLKYFEILETFMKERKKLEPSDSDAEDLTLVLNKYLEKLSEKYEEEFLYFIMKKAGDESIFFTASAVVFRKHNIVIKAVIQSDGRTKWLTTKFVESDSNVTKPY
jgi:hypothetical protein